MGNSLFTEKGSLLREILFPLYIVLSISFLTWSFFIIRSWHVWYAYPIFISQIYGVIMTLLYLITTKKMWVPIWRPPLKNLGDVDVFIPTYNEPSYIVKMTTVGALSIKGVGKVFVLDDGNRREIKEMTERLGAVYIAREDRSHAKAGNLNNGLQYSQAAFLIFLDCDHVPQSNFIERTLGYFSDENLAFVQTPQTYYNTDSIQFRKSATRNFWNEQSSFYESIQPSKNAFNAAFFCGSGAMIRRSAIDSVGGIATGTITEDIHTSLKLHAKGWKSLYVNEQLAHGLAADDLVEYHKQRVRWGAGGLTVLFRSPDSPLFAKGLTLMQRICYFNSTFSVFNGLLRLFSLLLPGLILLTLPFIPGQENAQLFEYFIYFLPFLLFSYFVTYHYSNGTFNPVHSEQFNIANIFSNILALKGIVQIRAKFNVSRKGKTEKETSMAYYSIVILFIYMIMANIFGLYYSFVFLHKTLFEFLGSTVAIAFGWNTFNIFFVLAFILFLNNHNNQERTGHLLPTSLRASVVSQPIKGMVTNINLHTLRLVLDSAPPRMKMRVSIEITGKKRLILPGMITEYEKQPLSNKHFITMEIGNLSISKERKLISLLFHKIVPEMYENDFIQAEGLGTKLKSALARMYEGLNVESEERHLSTVWLRIE